MKLGLAIAIILSLFATGCPGAKPTPTPVPPTPTATPSPTPEAAKPSAGGEYRLEVFVAGQKVAALGFGDLAKMPQVSLDSSTVERGPTLLSVLQRAGVTDFNRVKVTGRSRGREAPASLSLSKAEVTEKVVLGLTQKGTSKLAGSEIARESWVIDVERIEVEGSAPPGSDQYRIEVRVSGQATASLSIQDLRALPLKSYGDSEGPTLLSVLELAGAKDWKQVRLVGLSIGRKGPAQVVLTREQVTEDVILDFTNAGTVKLAGPGISRENSVLDVTRLEAE